MIRLVADENSNGYVFRGLIRRLPGLDIVRIQDVGLRGADDLAVLEWATDQGRMLLTHDRATIPDFVNDRLRLGLSTAGVLVVDIRLSVRRAIEEIRYIIETSEVFEWVDVVQYLPI